jgi:hypothetical protein
VTSPDRAHIEYFDASPIELLTKVILAEQQLLKGPVRLPL